MAKNTQTGSNTGAMVLGGLVIGGAIGVGVGLLTGDAGAGKESADAMTQVFQASAGSAEGVADTLLSNMDPDKLKLLADKGIITIDGDTITVVKDITADKLTAAGIDPAAYKDLLALDSFHGPIAEHIATLSDNPDFWSLNGDQIQNLVEAGKLTAEQAEAYTSMQGLVSSARLDAFGDVMGLKIIESADKANVQALVDAGLLEVKDGAWKLAGPLEALPPEELNRMLGSAGAIELAAYTEPLQTASTSLSLEQQELLSSLIVSEHFETLQALSGNIDVTQNILTMNGEELKDAFPTATSAGAIGQLQDIQQAALKTLETGPDTMQLAKYGGVGGAVGAAGGYLMSDKGGNNAAKQKGWRNTVAQQKQAQAMQGPNPYLA